MHVTHIKLCNFGPFRLFESSLTLGSIGVFARNGVGKTTLLNALYALVTGDFGRFDGLKIDNICTLAEKDAPSYIEGSVVHNGVTAKIKRSLRPAKQELHVEGEDVITSDKGIRERLNTFFGVDKDLIDRFCFKQQNKIHDFLSDEPASRAKAYQTLCRTEACEDAWKLLGQAITQDSYGFGEIADNSDELSQAIHQETEQCASLLAEKKTAQSALLNVKSLASAEEIMNKRRACTAAIAERDKLTGERAKLRQLCEGAENDACVDKAKLSSAESALVAAEALAEAAQLQLASLTEREQRRGWKRELLRQHEILGTEFRARAVPPVVKASALKSFVSDIGEWEARFNKAREVLRRLESSGVVACPICATPVKDLAEYIKAQRGIVKTHPAAIAELRAGLKTAEFDAAERHKWEAWAAAMRAKLDGVSVQLATLEDGDVTVDEHAKHVECAAQIDALRSRRIDKRHLQTNSERSALYAAECAVRLGVRENDLADAAQRIADNTVDDELYERAERRINEHRGALLVLARLDGELAASQRKLAADKAALQQLRDKLKQRQRGRRMLKIMEEARDLLHRDHLPREVAKVNLARIEGEINNSGLKMFGAPFWVEAQDDLTFLVHKPAEPPQAQGRLSTGQRVILAMAFWAAVGLLWSSELGMLALDEPTANLDEENRRFLGEALGKLTAQIRGNRQIIMVTHDQALRASFAQVVEL